MGVEVPEKCRLLARSVVMGRLLDWSLQLLGMRAESRRRGARMRR